MKLSDFDYNLPIDLIAQKPLEKRDSSRLLVLDKTTGKISHRHFYNIVEYFKPGDVLVLNDTKVFPARLLGFKKNTGGKVEVLLNKEIEEGIWEVLGRNIRIGDKINFTGTKLSAKVMKKYEEVYEISFNFSGNKFFNEINKIGHTPLPPYIKRSDTDQDKKEYQTVYADKIGSAAAPTAGLHFTRELLLKIESLGVIIVNVTLNVGLGTFSPVKTDQIEDHKIHSEYYSVTKDNIKKIIKAKQDGRRIIAIGTTSTRVLEHLFSRTSDLMKADNLSGWTSIFIYPGHEFKCVDGLITNFHLPKSTLLMLVSAFAGKKYIDRAYEEAIEQRYRFFSYGDAMLIV